MAGAGRGSGWIAPSRLAARRPEPPWSLGGVLLLAGGIIVSSGVGAATVPSRPPTPALVLSFGPLLARTPPTFWSVDLQTNNSTGVWTDPGVRAFLNATPYTWVRYGRGTEGCDIVANLLYANNGTPTAPCEYNLSAFGQWCRSRTPTCHAILDLPGELNDSALDASTASWIVARLGFAPAYWTIGNEPEDWTHYGIPWANWSVNDSSTPSPLAYAIDVHDAIAAVRAGLPHARFIGIEAACACGAPYFRAVVHRNAANLSAVAYHSYPSSGSTNETLGQFLAPLSSPLNLSSTDATVRGYLAGACPRCDRLPIFLNEYNAGPSTGHSAWSGTYANALFLAASTVQALAANITQFSWFNLQSNLTQFGYAMINRTDTIGPTGLLATFLLTHLALGRVYGTGLPTERGRLWSVWTQGVHRTTLLVVNSNLTTSWTVNVTSVLPAGGTAELGAWGPNASAPTWQSTRIASSYRVGPEGILVLSVPASEAPSAPPTPGGAPGRGWAGGLGSPIVTAAAAKPGSPTGDRSARGIPPGATPRGPRRTASPLRRLDRGGVSRARRNSQVAFVELHMAARRSVPPGPGSRPGARTAAERSA